MIDYVDVWLTRGGVRMKPEEMALDHQINTLHLLLRRTQHLMFVETALIISKHPEDSVDDEFMDDAFRPTEVWTRALERIPVLGRIRQLVEEDPRPARKWTPESSYPWRPVWLRPDGRLVEVRPKEERPPVV